MSASFPDQEDRKASNGYSLKPGRGMKFLLAILGIILASNLIFLNLVTFGLLEPLANNTETASDDLKTQAEAPSLPSATPTDLPVVLPTFGQPPPDDTIPCPEACMYLMGEMQVANENKKTESTPTGVFIKEYYLPLGSGSTTSRDWQEISGAEIVIDADNFSNVKSIIWEAVLRLPTGNGLVQAKLYNVTDKHEVWYSEVGSGSSTAYRAESAEIQLSPGRKLYRVMMRSTMGYEAFLDSGRIKILLE